MQRLTHFIDGFLNKITMYRLVLYFLLVLCAFAMLCGALGWLPYDPVAILASVIFITIVCLAVNTIFGAVFKVPVNAESAYITALILVLIISPYSGKDFAEYFSIALWSSVWAMASKYMFAIGRKHLFNPAAIGVAITALFLGQPATWWVGNLPMTFVVAVGGGLVVRKIRRGDLWWSFAITALLCIVGSSFIRSGLHFETFFSTSMKAIERTLFHSSLLFFGLVMLTEPLTTPPTRTLRIIYGIFVGSMFVPSFHIFNVYFTPEIALIVGNIFVYIVSSKAKLLLSLEKKIPMSGGVVDFWFSSPQKLQFKPGQYLEWTLAFKNTQLDTRGNRRYFTISSSPTENGIAMGVKFYEPGSAFKKELAALLPGDSIVASQLAGDFTMPKDRSKKLAFISGGIGVTPFRSMIKYLIDTDEERSIVHLYTNKRPEDVVYKAVFDEAAQKKGINTLYIITDTTAQAPSWVHHVGRIDERIILSTIPDFKERIFYLSGPRGMVDEFDITLRKLGLHRKQIKKDYFPGFV